MHNTAHMECAMQSIRRRTPLHRNTHSALRASLSAASCVRPTSSALRCPFTKISPRILLTPLRLQQHQAMTSWVRTSHPHCQHHQKHTQSTRFENSSLTKEYFKNVGFTEPPCQKSQCIMNDILKSVQKPLTPSPLVYCCIGSWKWWQFWTTPESTIENNQWSNNMSAAPKLYANHLHL